MGLEMTYFLMGLFSVISIMAIYLWVKETND